MLLNQAASANIITIILYVVVFGAIIYFMMIRPQKKQQKEAAAMHASMQAGDSVLTTSGFYGVIIDIMDNTVIVEFGNNRNCRIPMKKSAIAEIEKAADGAADAKDSKETKEIKDKETKDAQKDTAKEKK